ncbi:hypothetical protein ACVII0_002109 [Sinorhizobium meliloti]
MSRRPPGRAGALAHEVDGDLRVDAEAGDPQTHHAGDGIERTDAAGGFDLHRVPSGFDDEFQLFQRRGARRPAGAGLHEGGSAFGNDRRRRPDLLVRQMGEFQNDLERHRGNSLCDGAYLVADIAEVAGFEAADIDHHVEFLRAVLGKLHSLGGLGTGAVAARGEAHRTADKRQAARGDEASEQRHEIRQGMRSDEPFRNRDSRQLPHVRLRVEGLDGADIDQGGEIARGERGRRLAAVACVVHLYVSVLVRR